MTDSPDIPDELPDAPEDLAAQHPDVWERYADLGRACSEAGPIDDETRRLVKLAIAAGAGSEGAVHSHVRRALDEGVSPDALRHVAILSIPTIGFPNAMAALTWIDDLAEE